MEYSSHPTHDFSHIKVGDYVTRMLAGTVPMKVRVSIITDDLIISGPDEESGYCFDRKTGAEVDKQLGWGIRDPQGNLSPTGSFLVPTEPAPSSEPDDATLLKAMGEFLEEKE
jgi:hypothetical protein